MYTLRNETTNEQVRNALEELTCILTEPLLYLEGSSTLASDDLGTEEPEFVKDAPAPVANPASDEEYDEDESGSPSPSEPRKHLFDIPPSLLPCPEELTGSARGTARPNTVEDYEFGLELNAKMSAGPAARALSAAILCVASAILLALGT
ncbi:hypothetical protein R5R35_012564 [Gryllus longicercus]|uniref:Uncharacterized protein n=1 Tax=Gryllus longicercus TaxID=2509291 RepID=A0AAN9VN26_9ORTH